MKIKCLENRNGSEWYLTVGKVYDVKEVSSNSYPGKLVRLIDDVGDMVNIYMKDSGHGKFEVVEE